MSTVLEHAASSIPANFEEQMRQLLVASGYSDLRNVLIACDDSVVCLRGSVNSHHHKQLAQALLMPMAGMERRVINRLEVISNQGGNIRRNRFDGLW